MTRILVLADTHLPKGERALQSSILRAAETADLIAHLGDFTGLKLVHELEDLGPLVGVQGNNDSPEVQSRFPVVRRLQIGRHRLALIHGHIGGRTALASARAVTDADVVLFGHSHRAQLVQEEGRLLLNPGSPTERRFTPFTSYAILEVGEVVQAEIVRLS